MGKICIPVFDCQMLKEAAKKSGLVEVRLDRFREREIEKLLVAARKIKARLILTIRKKGEGGRFKGSERERLGMILKMMEEVRFPYVDVELSSGREFIEKVKKEAEKRGAKLILSRHYAFTPSKKAFLQTYAKMRSLGANICKIVGTARNERDCENAMGALRKVREGTALFFCMGEKGKKTRIECLKFGAPFTYASLRKGKESAKGQYSFGEMKRNR